jgi:Uma2 family endonuclease
MSAIAKRKLTTAEYLAIEANAPFKSEFFDGEMYAMAGASPEHNYVTENLSVEIGGRLKGGPCRTVSSDLRLKIERTGLYTYPDLMIICNRPEYDPADRNTLLNPFVVFEVLSPSTASYDRGTKRRHYQKLDSVREVVLVSQDEPVIEVYSRQPNGTWVLTTFEDPAGEFALTSVPVSVPMADVYRGVEFPPRELKSTDPRETQAP